MDLQEWEIVPEDGFLEIHDDGGRKIFSRKFRGHDPASDFHMNYFICPSPTKPPKNLNPLVEIPRFPDDDDGDQLVPALPIPKLQKIGGCRGIDHEVEKQVNSVLLSPVITHEKINSGEQDTVSQVFFKKMKETEFVDMKLDSPKSGGGRGFVPQLDAAAASTFQFEDFSSSNRGEATDGKIESENLSKKKSAVSDDHDKEEEEDGGLNVWKWSLTGIGAICSFGVAAAATICIVILGSHQKNKYQSQKLQFQIYTHDKQRIQQVVHDHATKLNEAISAVRGVPLNRAHITVGGYYEGL